MKNFKEIQEHWEKDNLYCNAKKSSEAIRWQTDKPDPYRTEYQRDVGRILYSDAFRRLRMKTQVFSASGTNQHDRTRLTHSIEVAQIAKSIARPLRLNVDLTEAIAFGHDLGHTPFGHAGEDALSTCLEGRSSFHHNVQSVWIVRSTLCRRCNVKGELYPGFNLTYDVVEGIWKHTKFENTVGEIEKLETLKPDKPSSLEGQLVDIADGITYLIHDVYDGVGNNLLTYGEVEEIWKKYTEFTFEKNNYNWGHYFIYDVINFSSEKEQISFSPSVQLIYNEIKKLVYEKVIKSDYIRGLDERGREIITTIYEYCVKNPEYVLNKSQTNRFTYNKYGLDRVIVNYIQWLGDENAKELYEWIINNNKC